MRVLFVSHLPLNAGTEPLGIMYLSSVLKQGGHETRFASADVESVLKECREFRPQILAYSVTTGYHRHFLNLNRQVKLSYNAFSIFGGPHVTFFPETIEEEGVDAICRGEGESALLELANTFKCGPKSDIENLWIKTDGQIYRNPLRPLEQDLNNLPFPDREFIFDRYTAVRELRTRSFISSRGCPYQCTYCFNHSYNEMYQGKGKIVRQRSVDNLISELKWVKTRYPMDIVIFSDDMFIISPDWIEEFSERYRAEIGIPFVCNVRANLVQERTIAALKKANCMTLVMGIESGNDYLRNDVLKRKMTREQIVEAARIIKGFGLSLQTQNIVGLPGETVTMAADTMRLNAEIRPDYAWIAIFQPYPRTELGKIAIEHGMFDGNPDGISPSYHESTALAGNQKKQINRLHSLFGLSVEFPILIAVIPFLVKLPLGVLYYLFYRIWRSYCHHFRIYRRNRRIGDVFRNVKKMIKPAAAR